MRFSRVEVPSGPVVVVAAELVAADAEPAAVVAA